MQVSFLLLPLLFVFSETFAQKDWEQFLNSVPETKIPLRFDSTNTFKGNCISLQDVYNYLIVPTSILNAKKEEEEQFSLDVSQMDNYEQRAGVDIHKPDTIEVFDNDGGGNIYAFKKVKLATSYTGIIWLFQRGHGKTSRISLYNGPQLWLFCYDQEGKCMDFIKLFEKLSNSTCPSCSDYKACTLQKTTDGLTELWLDELHINPQSEDFWNKDNETMRIIKTHAYQITESGTFLQK